jgi:hypothetical protein
MQKQSYVRPELVAFGSIEAITRGPITPSINDGLVGQGDNTNIGCQPADFQGPDYKLCDSGSGS